MQCADGYVGWDRLMKTRYVKALPENVKRINNLIKDGFKLYTVQKGINGTPVMLIFQKDKKE